MTLVIAPGMAKLVQRLLLEFHNPTNSQVNPLENSREYRIHAAQNLITQEP